MALERLVSVSYPPVRESSLGRLFNGGSPVLFTLHAGFMTGSAISLIHRNGSQRKERSWSPTANGGTGAGGEAVRAWLASG